MKKIAGMTITTLALCALLGTMAWAKGKSHTHAISFNENTMVNGTMVKKGDYEAKFDEQTSELTILNGNHVVATAKVKEKGLPKKADQTKYDLHQSANGPVLTQVTFGGDHYTLMLDDAGNGSGIE